MKVMCPKCNKKTKCFDDMIQQSYVAELYKCKKCKGEIEVVYDYKISKDRIKTFKYKQ